MTDTQKYFPDMTDEEQLASIKLFSNTERGLADAIALLNARKVNFDTDENELKRIRIELADKKAKLAKLRSKWIALEESGYAMPPPSPETIKNIKAQSDNLDKMIANAATADTIVDAANLLFKAWQNSQA